MSEPGDTLDTAVPSDRPRRSRRAAAIVAVVLLLMAGGVVAIVSLRSESEASTGAPVPHFVDEAASSGVEHVYDGEVDYFEGGGVATFDCSGDGFPELYLAGGVNPAALYRNDSDVGGELRFSPIASPVTDLVGVVGAYPLDVDGDGVTDLAVLRRGGNLMLRGDGDCGFTDVTEQLGLAQAADEWTVGFSATWEEGNALPTLAYGNYLLPDRSGCAASRFVRPADGTTYGPAEPLATHCALSVLFSDWARTGQRDLRVTNDRNYYRDGQEQLFEVLPGQPPSEYTAADGWNPLKIWGMGIASYDLTGDGKPEVFLTSQADNKLQTLDDGAAGPSYHDIALDRGVTAQRPYTGGDVLPSTGWHPEFDDVNNDGLIDLFVTKGNVEAQLDYASNDPNNLLLGQPDGTFSEAGADAGIANDARSRGAAVDDLNLDGLLDLVVVNRRTPVEVWRNVGTGTADAPEAMGHWLTVRLQQPAPDTDAVGAWLEVKVGDRVLSREVTVGGGHASGELGWLHTGLGDATQVEVRVQWPGSEPGPWTAVGTDRFVVITRGSDEPVPFTPGG